MSAELDQICLRKGICYIQFALPEFRRNCGSNKYGHWISYANRKLLVPALQKLVEVSREDPDHDLVLPDHHHPVIRGVEA